MDQQPIKVSVIVPVYGVELYLAQCIDSLLAQTYGNYEIILVDDGSPDKCGEICDHYAANHKKIKVIHQSNAGVSNARNAGLDAAVGDYVCFVDADDFVMPDYVAYLMELAGIHQSDIALTTEFFTTYHQAPTAREKTQCISSEEATISILTYHMPIGVYCKIFRKSFLDANAIRFEPELRIGEGFNFNTDAFQRANSVTVGNRKVYFYRRNNPTSATTKFSAAKWQNGLYAIQKIREKQIIHSKQMDVAIAYADWHTHRDVFDFIVLAHAENDNRNLYKVCKKHARRYAYLSFKVRVSLKERVRALVIMVMPRLIPKLMNVRNKKYVQQ